MSLKEHITDIIRAEGPISIARYMDLCLYHPQLGYYMTRQPMAEGGDFITAPEMTQAFGEVLGAWVIDCWQRLGSPTHWALVELGPGRGTLMSDVLRVLQRHAPQAYAGCSIHLVEISPILIQAQQEALKGHPISWHHGIEALPPLEVPLVLLANEFWDALPIQQFVDGQEQMVTVDNAGELAFTLPAGNITEACPALPALVKRLKTLTTCPSYQLYIDYGAEGTADTLQAMRQHQFCSPLDAPGEADLTAHVDFSALKEAFGASWAYIDQAGFIFNLGFPVRAARLMDAAKTPQEREKIALNCAKIMAPDGMGSLFKVGCFYTQGLATPAGF
jgi:SAM-dependent MidA family methyltransferase